LKQPTKVRAFFGTEKGSQIKKLAVDPKSLSFGFLGD